MNGRIIFETTDKQYRIVEHVDAHADIENLKGDIFNPKHIVEMHGPDKTLEELAAEEREFEDLVNREGVYGYVLERWNTDPGVGYEHVDSCWGFVGQYTPTEQTFNHYIVDELKAQIPTEAAQD
jgi:hypothetical protein